MESKHGLEPEIMTKNIRQYRIKKMAFRVREITKDIERMTGICQNKEELAVLSKELKECGLEDALDELIFTFSSSF